MRIKHILYMALIGFSVLPLLVFLVYMTESIDSYASDSFMARMKDTVTAQANAVEDHFDDLQALLSEQFDGVRAEAFFRDGVTDDDIQSLLSSTLLGAQMSNARIDSLSLLASDGSFIASSDQTRPDATLLENTRNRMMQTSGERPIFVGIYHDGVLDRNASCELFFLSRQQSKGYLLMAVKTDELSEILGGMKFSQSGTSFLASEKQQVFEFPFTFLQAIPSSSKYADLQKLDLFLRDDPFFTYNDGMWDYDAVSQPIKDTDWAIIGSSRRSEVRAGLTPTKNRILMFSVGLIMTTLILGITVIDRKMKPLDHLIFMLERINRGDYDSRLDASHKNEFGVIATSFNNLVEDIIISDSRYRNIVDMSDNIVFEWNIQKDTVFVSTSFNRKFTYRAPTDRFADSFLKKWNVYFEDSEKYAEDLEVLEHGDAFIESEYRIKDMYGGYIWMRMRAASLTDKEGNPLKAVGVLSDLDRGKRAELLLRERASYDALTELYNRGTFERMLTEEVGVTLRRGRVGGLFFVDVDNFKYFNDGFNHAVGDEVLRFIASCVRRMVEENGFAGRYGGDEFVAFARIPNKEAKGALATMAESLQTRLQAGYYSVIAECQLTVSTSIGIVLLDDACGQCEEVIKAADAAMYRIKENGKGRYGFLDD